jgi:hypothetical protein
MYHYMFDTTLERYRLATHSNITLELLGVLAVLRQVSASCYVDFRRQFPHTAVP